MATERTWTRISGGHDFGFGVLSAVDRSDDGIIVRHATYYDGHPDDAYYTAGSVVGDAGGPFPPDSVRCHNTLAAAMRERRQFDAD